MGSLNSRVYVGALILAVLAGASILFGVKETQPVGPPDVNFTTFPIAYIVHENYYRETDILFEEIIEPEINAYAEKERYGFTFDFKVISSNCGGGTLEVIQGLKLTGTEVVIGSNCVACVAYSYMENNEMILVSASKVQSSFSMKDDLMFEIAPPDHNTVPVCIAMIESWGITHPIMFQREGQIREKVNERFIEEWTALGKGEPSIVNVDMEDKTLSNDLETLENTIKTLLATGVPYERICVMTTLYELEDRFAEMDNHPETKKVVWFGTENTGRYSDPFNSSRSKVRGAFYPLAKVPESEKWEILKKNYSELTGQEASYVTATSYDAAWVIALTVMETSSNDTAVLTDTLSEVAISYNGITGWTHLDENGDRTPAYYGIYGYSEEDLTRYGYWDSSTYDITWDDEALARIGHTRVSD